MAEDRDIEIIIAAADQTKAAFQSVTQGLEGIDRNTKRLNNELGKMTSASSYAAQGLRRMQSIISSMAFGAVAGAVSAVVETLIDYYKESIVTEEQIQKLNQSIMAQERAWKILPDSMDKATESNIRTYNANLKVLQLAERDKDIGLRRKIENLEKHRIELEKNSGFMTQFGEIVGDNSLAIARDTAAIEKAREELEKWDALQKKQPTTIDAVNTALNGQTQLMQEAIELFKGSRIIRKMDQDDQQWWADRNQRMNLEAIALNNKKDEAYERNRQTIKALDTEYIKLTGTSDAYYMTIRREMEALGWNAAQIDAYIDKVKELDKVKKQITAREALRDLDANSPYGYMANLQEAAGLNEIAQLAYQQQTKLDMLTAYNTAVIEKMMEAGASQEDFARKGLEFEESYAIQAAYIKLTTAASLAGQLSAMSAEMYNTMGEQAIAAFYASKLLAVAQIIVNTEVAAARVGAEAGLFGLPLAALIKAQGYASAAMVAAMTIASRPSVPPAVRVSGGGSSSFGGGASIPAPPQTQQALPAQNININVYSLDPSSVNWDRLAENNIIPAINNAGNRNVKMNVNVIQA